MKSELGKAANLARVGSAMAIIAVLAGAPAITRWLEAMYPMRGGALGSVATTVVAAVVLWFLGAVTLLGWGFPSWVIATRLRPSDVAEVRAIRAAVISFVIQPVVHACILAVGGRDLSPERYRIAVLVTQAVLLIAAAFAHRQGEVNARGGQSRLIVFACLMLVAACLLVARIAWADLNPDGTELLTMGRSLSSFIVPRLPTSEIPGVNLGMLSIAYPIDWLLAIGGPSAIAARLPALAYIGLIALGLAAIVEQGAKRRLTTTEFALLVAGTIAACLTIGLNTSYDPYSTDLASPASIDLLAMAFFAATLYFLFTGEVAWCVIACVLQGLTRPSALLLCGMLFAALLVVERDLRSRQLWLAVATIVTTLVVSVLYTFPIETLTNGQVAEGGGDLLLRLRFLRFNDWGRLAYLIIPSGIVPALLMIRWRSADARGRVLSLVTLAYFAFFYMLAFISLHHFAPAMLLPIAVLWRYEATRETGSTHALRMVVATGVLVAIGAALPRAMTPFRATRVVAAQISFEPGNVTGAQLFSNTFDASRALDSLFTPYFRVADPQAERVGDPMSLAWYATLAKSSRDSARYIVQAAGDDAPDEATPIGTARGFTLFARDIPAWRALRSQPPPPDVRSRLYDVPRTTLFQHFGRQAHVYQLDVKELGCRILKRSSICAASPGDPATGT